MKPIEGYELINEAGELKRLPAGPYICRIIEVNDVPQSEYLDVYFDIADGEFKGYFGTLQKNSGNNYGRIIRSYKANALPFFKAFITAVEKSNPDYKWDWDEKGLNNKWCVINFRDEEYLSDGQVKVRAKPAEVRSLQAFRAGEIKLLAPKKLEVEEERNLEKIDLTDDDIPF